MILVTLLCSQIIDVAANSPGAIDSAQWSLGLWGEYQQLGSGQATSGPGRLGWASCRYRWLLVLPCKGNGADSATNHIKHACSGGPQSDL